MGGVTRVARTFVASREGGKEFGGGDTSSITWRKVEVRLNLNTLNNWAWAALRKPDLDQLDFSPYWSAVVTHDYALNTSGRYIPIPERNSLSSPVKVTLPDLGFKSGPATRLLEIRETDRQIDNHQLALSGPFESDSTPSTPALWNFDGEIFEKTDKAVVDSEARLRKLLRRLEL
ncbi:hypothetical protein WN943_004288 [Citrus x changshan-huyou]